MTFKEALRIIEKAFEDEKFLSDPVNLYKPIDYTLKNGGKRLRPVLLLMGNCMFDENYSNAVKAALGVEVFHNFTLLHDDIMDKAPIRRGKPTVHIKWDDNSAILSGDAMLIKAYQFIAQVPNCYMSDVFNVFSQTALEVCEGQQYDMDFEKRENVAESEYIEMIRLKTAVLLGGSLKIGAILGGASKEDQNNLYDFGINLGLAFQLMDDWLDVFGDEKTFGKKPGGDILSNKKTFLLINAQQRAQDVVKEELQNWISAKDYDQEQKVNGVTRIFKDLQIGELATERMEMYFEKGLKALNLVNVPEAKKENLKNLAMKMMKRTN